MRFSILIPVYNAAQYLPACLDSVFAQTAGEYEVVLVDDGSTDESGALCDERAARFPGKVTVVHQKNQGLISARRAGITAAQGDYCLFLDADDAFVPDCLAAVDACIRKTGADMVLFTCRNVFEDTGETRDVPPVFEDGRVFTGDGKRAVYRELIAGWRLNNLCLKAIRRPLLTGDDTPFEAFFAIPYAEDLLQTLYPATHAHTIAYLARPLYLYRRRADSISSAALSGGIEGQFIEPVMERLRSYMTVWGMDTSEYLALYHARRLTGLLTLFWQHYRAAGSRAERRQVLDYPWGKHVSPEDARYLNAACLPRAKRVQLHAILHKNALILEAFRVLARRKGRKHHG